MRVGFGDCELRGYRRSDIRALVRYADNPRIARSLRDRFPQPYTRDDAVAWIRYTREQPADTHFAIARKGEVIGSIGLYPKEDVYSRSAEVGYWLAEEHWGRGIATGAVAAICDIGFSRDDLERIFACVFQNNVASCRVLEKSGFELEGVHRNAVWKDGVFIDERVYGLLRDDWKRLRAAESSDQATGSAE